MKLQQAYAAESNAAGGWVLIGYTGPGTATGDNNATQTTNFAYTGAITANTVATSATENAWKAMARVNLNNCTTSGAWAVKVTPGEGGSVAFEASISGETNPGDCESLTPTFKKIGG